ncbi:MAG TPA: hypothetical protein VMT75_12725 [Candidatus Saccharimonadales bacterium]|nr:hypothetical protein [Candidatus Saccharimonadales bacterium]
MNAQDYQAPAGVSRVQSLGLIVGGAALVLSIVGAFLSPEKFYQSYLFSYMLVLGLTLGSLGLLMLQHLTGGRWGIVIRRPLEAASRVLPLTAILFIPIVFGMKSLYSAWLDPEKVKEEPLSPFQQGYLTHSGFLVRAVIYFVIWLGLMLLFNKWSKQQDVDRDDRALRRRLKMWAGPGVILYVLAMTFASIDWVMSLSPHWASTIYGFIFVAGQAITAMSLMIIVVVALSSTPYGAVYKQRMHDLGKWLFTFNMLWAYFDFSQLLIIWSGNQPEEISFYRTRLYGGWGVVAVIVLLFSFALPFLILLSEHVKKTPSLISKVALWMIIFRLVDLYWMTRPEFTKNPTLYWLDIVVPVALVGLWVGFFAMNLKQRPLLPLGDPKLAEAIAHEH